MSDTISICRQLLENSRGAVEGAAADAYLKILDQRRLGRVTTEQVREIYRQTNINEFNKHVVSFAKKELFKIQGGTLPDFLNCRFYKEDDMKFKQVEASAVNSCMEESKSFKKIHAYWAERIAISRETRNARYSDSHGIDLYNAENYKLDNYGEQK